MTPDTPAPRPQDYSEQATEAMNAGDYAKACHLWILKVDNVYKLLTIAEQRVKRLETALRDTCDAIPEETLALDPPLRSWVALGRAELDGHGRPQS
mgnify:CR=1 FL=1